MLNRAFYESALVQTEQHVRKGEAHVMRQREIVAEKVQKGLECGSSNSLLATFEALLVEHKAHRDSLVKSLAGFSEEGKGGPPRIAYSAADSSAG